MIEVKFTEEFKDKSSCLCIFASEGSELSNNAKVIDKKYNGIASKFFKSSNSFTGKFAQTKILTTVSKDEDIHNIVIIGLGKEEELTETKIQELGGSLASALRSLKTASAFILSEKIGKFESEDFSTNIAFGVLLGSYNFNKYFTTKKAEELPCLQEIELMVNSTKKAIEKFEDLAAVASGIYACRDVCSEPANILYPESYSNIISETLEPLDVKVEVLGEREMKNLGMNSLLGVGQGSIKESKLVVMSYFGGKNGDAPVALVGKGVTFDTGGISIKPSRNMGDMKYDMSGSGAVFGTMLTLAKRRAKVNVVGVVGLVENMPGGNAQRPGDVVKSMSGQTIEVLDTDAEGRLVLADALWYTQDRFKPKIIIDLATLTGAVSIALANVYAGLFSNDDPLAENLLKAGKKSGEELWRLPLHPKFDDMIKSSIADVANLGNPPGHASSSIGGQFLQKFVNNVPWAHLDIAGVAYDSKAKSLAPSGSAGYGIRLLNKLISEFYE